jgi:hypothetical protein
MFSFAVIGHTVKADVWLAFGESAVIDELIGTKAEYVSNPE